VENNHPVGLFKFGAFTKNRVETFSDGIFAIIVTLLILEIKVPHLEHVGSSRELFFASIALLPKFASWVISFVTLCIVWVNHHRLFESFKSINMELFWLNVHILLWICFVPYPTALLGDYPHNALAVASYGIAMFLVGAAFIIARLYLVRNKTLLKETVNVRQYKRGMRYVVLFGLVPYLAGAALAWINPTLSFVCYFLIAVFFVFSFASKG